jgi:hypothetical protein
MAGCRFFVFRWIVAPLQPRPDFAPEGNVERPAMLAAIRLRLLACPGIPVRRVRGRSDAGRRLPADTDQASFPA